MTPLERTRGAMLGLAVGDALAHPTAGIPTVAAIRERWGPAGVTGFVSAGRHPAGAVTDDTQTALAVARALCHRGARDRDVFMAALGDELAAWSRSAQNNRAPSGTVLAACRNLARGVHWRECGVKGSKGAGAATRATPVGLTRRDDDEVSRFAASQAAATHAHPTAVASAVAAASAVAWAARGGGLDGLVAHARARVAALTVDDFVDAGCVPGVAELVGGREALASLDRAASLAGQESDDVCALLGEARVADEAVACALWCVLRAPGDPDAALRRAANSSGASDAVACLAGAMAGALYGADALDAGMRAAVEYGPALEALARSLHDGDEAPASSDVFGADRFALRPEDMQGEEDTVIEAVPEALRMHRLATGAHPHTRK